MIIQRIHAKSKDLLKQRLQELLLVHVHARYTDHATSKDKFSTLNAYNLHSQAFQKILFSLI
jgi:hypothetical protein